MFYVYEYLDPRDNTPFYVGKGSGKRMFFHLSETAENTENIYKHRKIQQILKLGLEPIIQKVYENLEEETAYKLEEELIIKYGRKRYDDGGVLTNLCVGSRPPCNKGKDHYLYNKKHPEWVCEKMKKNQ